MMLQWRSCKESAKDALLLFRLGDFYEAFYEDAITLSQDAGVTLTKRQDVPMAGVPAHSADSYIEKLVRQGHLVAIAEQTEDPKNVKGIVKREVVRIVSPATLLSDTYLSEKSANYFISICKLHHAWGLSRLDLSTGKFDIAEYGDPKQLIDDIYKSTPSELLVQKKVRESLERELAELRRSLSLRVTEKDDWEYEPSIAYDFLLRHFSVHSLDGFGITAKGAATLSAGVLLTHLKDTLSQSLSHVKKIAPLTQTHFVRIDRATERNLELLTPLRKGSSSTLFECIDYTKTPMGARLLAEWILHPLSNKKGIERRLAAVEELVENAPLLREISETLLHVKDIERLLSRITSSQCSPRDLAALRFSLEALPKLLSLLPLLSETLFSKVIAKISLPHPGSYIGEILVDEPPARHTDGNLIQSGVDKELDDLRSVKRDAQHFLAEYQESLRESLGIKTLKVGFSKAFGYFIEVSRGQATKMPSSFERRQTLVNAERFISPELKEFEHKILTADEKITEIELLLYTKVKEHVAAFSENILTIAGGLAELDCLHSHARCALIHEYTKPTIVAEPEVTIKGGRHPIVERVLPPHGFVANDTTIAPTSTALMLITGPNMAGKSTYIRQVALITLLSHIGSFVPASSATIGVVDQIFSRIGASDDLTRGQSTFMVEMAETANILNNATEKSLIILDEIGRGTSTYDGIAIAWATAEYLLTHFTTPLQTLFATHYSELTELESLFSNAKNFHVAVKESGTSISFLHHIAEGGSDKSYGIHVAKLAGVPEKALRIANERLYKLLTGEKYQPLPPAQVETHPNPALLLLSTLDVDEMTPKSALETLYQLKECLKKSTYPDFS